MTHTAKPITILYIDDDETNRELLGFIIARRESWTMIEASDGTSGLSAAIENRPEVILLDISLPDMDGNEVLDLLKNDARTASIPVIAVTGKASPTDIALGLQQGFTDYLGKPIELDQVYSAIEKALG